jgi:hypothetical protein
LNFKAKMDLEDNPLNIEEEELLDEEVIDQDFNEK